MMREDRIIALANEIFEGVNGLYYIPDIPLRQVMKLSDRFKDINLSHEDLFLVIPKEKELPSLALTNKHLYLVVNDIPENVPVSDMVLARKKLSSSDYDLETQNKIIRFMSKLNRGNFPKDKDPFSNLNTSSFDDFVTKMKELGDMIEERAAGVVEKRNMKTASDHFKKTSSSDEITEETHSVTAVIDAQYLDLLVQEGDKLWETIVSLNNDESFMKILHQSIASSDIISKEFGAQHVMIQDLVKIYRICDSEKTPIKEKKAQYSLAYLFERLQDKDMAKMLSLERINEMISKPKFNESIDKLKNANYLQLPPNYDGQLFMPSLLSRLKHPLFEKCATHYIRYANILLKADGEISSEEEVALKKINRDED